MTAAAKLQRCRSEAELKLAVQSNLSSAVTISVGAWGHGKKECRFQDQKQLLFTAAGLHHESPDQKQVLQLSCEGSSDTVPRRVALGL